MSFVERKQVGMCVEAYAAECSGKGNNVAPVSQKAASLLPHCMVCGEIPERGIMGGIFVRGQFLCDDCEQEIVALDGAVMEEKDYLAVAGKLKSWWGMVSITG